MQNHALHGAAIYGHKADKLFVNLFIPSELTWREQGARVTQVTSFPDEPRTTLKMTLSAPKKLTLAVRVPSWVEPGAMKLAVNNKPITTRTQPGTYAEVTREWMDGDALTIELPMKLHIEMLPNNNDYVSVFYGPILLAAKLGSAGLSEADFHSGTSMPAKDKLPAAQIPVMVRPAAEIVKHLQPIKGKPLVFQTQDLCKPADVTLVPINRIYDERYSLYFSLMTSEKWEAAKQQWAVEEQQERERLRRTVDEVRCGEQQPEMDHKIKSEMSKNGWKTEAGRAYREAINGWFSYEMLVDGQAPMTLSCTYWGSDKKNREFDILVDDTPIATQQLEELKLGDFVEILYPIPSSLTRNKEHVVVKFQAKKNRIAGGVYSCRILNMTPNIEDAEKAPRPQLNSAQQRQQQRNAPWRSRSRHVSPPA
jgi:uncharacterized protein